MTTFKKKMEKEQMLHFPYYFQILNISKASKGVIMEYRVNKSQNAKTCFSGLIRVISNTHVVIIA